MAAAASAIVFVACFGVNHVTGGAITGTIKKIFNIDQGRQDVVGGIDDDMERNPIYAPNIYYSDANLVLFGGLRGLILYDLQKESVAGFIDVQSIDCIHFNSDTQKTHVINSADGLVIYNTKHNQPIGSYYVYDITECNGGELAPLKKGSDQKQLFSYHSEWKKLNEMVLNTFEFSSGKSNLLYLIKDDFTNYSENSFPWINESSELCYRFLIGKDDTYTLCTYNTVSHKPTRQAIDLSNYEVPASDGGTVALNKYTYTGDNPAIKAIYEYLEPEYMEYMEDGQVYIPGYVIHLEENKGDEHLVFGNFWAYGYQLSGNILEVESGGEKPACFHLEKTADGYQVKSVEFVGDGDEYADKIKEITKGYPELYDTFMEQNEEAKMNAQREYLQMYVSDNNLDIKYFKQGGWDPVKIMNE